MRALYDKYLPPYCRWPLLIILVCNMLAYFIPGKLVPLATEPFGLATAWDTALPFCSFFILFYVLAYVQWFGSYIYHCGRNRELCYRMVAASVIAKAVCVLFFVLMPTTIQRPEVTGGGVFEWGVWFIYRMDTPVNLFPSIHCLESWMCLRMALRDRPQPRWYVAAQLILTLLVFASTVLIKQHFLVDIAGGVAVAELALLLSGPTGLWRIGERLAHRRKERRAHG